MLSLALVAAGFLPSVLQQVNPAFGALGILVLPVSLFSIGFYGTQRIWYLRLFHGTTLTANDIWSFSWRFLGRFVVLGIITGWPVMLATMLYVITLLVGAFSNYQVGQPPPRPQMTFGPLLVLVVLVTLTWDFLLTFATPALAFTTASAPEAFRIGLRMIRETWPAAALYVLFPPLALQFLSLSPGLVGTRSLPAIYAGGVVVAMLNLAAKGAVAAFYVRRVGVGEYGSLYQAWPGSPPSLPPSVAVTA